MAFVLADRVKESTTTVGTGALTLAGAGTGFQSWLAGIGVGNSSFYTIVGIGTGEWEVGIGTLSAGTTLTRDTVISSSNANAAVTFSAGSKDVFCAHPASRAVIGGEGLIETSQVIDRNVSITPGNNAISAGPVQVANGFTVTVPTGAVWSIV
jgi:hypothetical protein